MRLCGLLQGTPLTGPQTVHVDIANGCNTRCATCWHHSPHLDPARAPDPAWKRRTLSLCAFSALLDDLLALGGLEQIILSGMGEPTLNEALYDMVERAHGRGVGVTVITNLLAADLPRLLDSRGELELLVSVCGVTRQVWQAFHGDRPTGGFAALRGQLELLRERGFLPKHVQVINAQNVHELTEMVRFARTYPAKRVSFKLAALGQGTEVTALSRAQRAALLKRQIPEALELARRLGVQTDLEAFRSQVSTGAGLTDGRTAPIEAVGCNMGFLYSRVTVEGELLYCCDPSISVGHLRSDGGFSQLWRSARYQALRQRLARGQFFPGCHRCGKYKENLKWSQKLRDRARRAMGRGGPS